MPDAGDRKKYYIYCTWVICPSCNKGRWVHTNTLTHNRKSASFTGRCRLCQLEVNRPSQTKGEPVYSLDGRKVSKGYILVRLGKNSFFYPMVDKAGYIREHRLIMAQHLKRCLLSWEVVHHLGTKYPLGSIENRQDNRIENLQIMKDIPHQQITILENKITRLERALIHPE